MEEHFYFICPTDQIENIIDDAFNQENYYYTSLGNSITFDEKIVEQLLDFLEAKNIDKISFVLSSENRIIQDALGVKDYSKIMGLNVFYNQLSVQKDNADVLWKTNNDQYLILSYHLNKKIKELRQVLENTSYGQVEIYGKIYNCQEMVFDDIYPEFVCKEYHELN